MFGMGIWEIALVLVVVLVFFGPKRLPEIGRGLGKGIREFKKAGRELSASFDDDSEKLPPNTIDHEIKKD